VIDRIEDRPPDGSHRARLPPRVEAQIRDIIWREGIFRVPKAAGCFVADLRVPVRRRCRPRRLTCQSDDELTRPRLPTWNG
jgi:hypothetical protein